MATYDYSRNLVKDYGADPSKSDNSTEIQNALDDANQNGYEVLIPHGTYRIQSKLTIGQKTKLRGVGIKKTTLLCDKSGLYAANSAKNTYDIQISDMKIKSNTTSGNYDYHGIEIRGDDGVNAGRLDLYNLVVESFRNDGIIIHRPILSRLANITSKNTNGHGFYISGGGTSTTLKNCFATNNNGHGYLWEKVQYSSLINCAADKNNVDGYHIKPDNQVANLSFYGCGAEYNDQHQFYLSRIWGLTLNSLTALPSDAAGNSLYLDGTRQTVVNGIYMAHTPSSGYYSLKIDDDNGNMFPQDVVIIGSRFGNSTGTGYSEVKIINSTY